MAIPHVFITTNSMVRVFSLTASSTAISEFPVHGFPSTPMTFESGVSEPCTYYIGTSGGSITLVTYESLTDGGTCSFQSGGEREPDRKGDETGVAGEEDINDQIEQDGDESVEVDVTIGEDLKDLPDSMIQQTSSAASNDGSKFDVADPEKEEEGSEAGMGESFPADQLVEMVGDLDDEEMFPCEPIDMSQSL